MAASSTSQIAVSTLLDLVGAASPTQRDPSARTVFDALLQPPRTAEAQPAPADSPREERPASSRAPVAADDNSHGADSGREPGVPEVDAALAEMPADAPAQAVEAAAGEDDVVLSETATTDVADGAAAAPEAELAAQSLAGLAAVALPPTQPAPIPESADEAATAVLADAPEGQAGKQPRRSPLPASLEQAAIAGESRPVVASAAEGAAPEAAAPAAKANEPGEAALAADRPTAQPELPAELRDLLATTGEQAAEANVSSAGLVPAPSNPSERQSQKEAGREAPTTSPASAVKAADPAASLPATGTAAPPPVAAVPQPSAAAPAAPASQAKSDAAPIGAAAPGAARQRAAAFAGRPEAVAGRGAPAIDTARLVHRVARAVAAAQSQDGEIRLRLSPPELGALKLQVQVVEGALSIHCEAETPEARAALLDNLPALRERLAEQAVRIERFDVDLMNRQAPGNPDRRQADQRPEPPPPRGEPARRPAAAAAERPARAVADATGRLNVII